MRSASGLQRHTVNGRGKRSLLFRFARNEARGHLTAVDPGQLVDRAVIAELRTRADLGIEDRKAIIEFIERVIEERTEVIAEEREAIAQEQQEIDERQAEIGDEEIRNRTRD